MPRPQYIPTFEDQLRVRELAAIGMSEEDIATQLRVPLPKMQKAFRQELKEGAAGGREHALKKLHATAVLGDNIHALTFWIKSKCGWRDTGVPQNAPNVINSVLVIKTTAKTDINLDRTEPRPSEP